jgi:hypothetical protein
MREPCLKVYPAWREQQKTL